MIAALDPVLVGVIVAVVAAVLGLGTAFLGWVAREMYRTSSLLNRLDERSEATDARVERIDQRVGRVESRLDRRTH